MTDEPHAADRAGTDRRTLLRRAAAAGAIGWTAPILTSATASAVFTPKCSAGPVTASRSFIRTRCDARGTAGTITLSFAATCPCGGTARWCATAPGAALSNTATITFGFTLAINTSVTYRGSVAVGCVDRTNEVRWTRYNWAIVATDTGGSCAGTPVVIGQPTLTRIGTSDQPTCPLIGVAAPAPVIQAGTARTSGGREGEPATPVGESIPPSG